MTRDEREELASLHALGLLEGAELAAFERELAKDPALAELVAEFEHASTLLAADLPHAPAPDALRHSILQEIHNRQASLQPASGTGGGFPGWIPWALAAGLAIFCGLLWSQKAELFATNERLHREGGLMQARLDHLEGERALLEVRLNKLEAEKSALQFRVASLERHDPLDDVRPVVLTPQTGAPSGDNLVALWDGKQRAGCVNLDALPRPASGKDYQMWVITPASPQPVSAGVLASVPGHHAMFNATQPVVEVAALAISIEPAGGSLSPQGPVIYLGKF